MPPWTMLLRKEDVGMRTDFDFSPLFRSTVGFDRMFNLLQHAARGAEDSYPPYDIDRVDEDSYRVTLAVAGFRAEDLDIVAHQNLLLIKGERRNRDDGSAEQRRQTLHRGIAGRPFERRFELADYVKVVGADLANGLLTIDLKREVPEEMRPRRIEVRGGTSLSGPQAMRQVEGEARAA